MQKNIQWAGKQYNSSENCLLTKTNTGVKVNSVIVGTSDNKSFRIEYLIKTNINWETIFVKVKSQIANSTTCLSFQSDTKGLWNMDGKRAEEFSSCIDTDISLTPFTNTLPINRLNMAMNEQQQIKVLYFDILEQQVKPVMQKYTRLSKTEYKFENVPNDFEAVIEVDESGIVVNYPELFVRTNK